MIYFALRKKPKPVFVIPESEVTIADTLEKLNTIRKIYDYDFYTLN